MNERETTLREMPPRRWTQRELSELRRLARTTGPGTIAAKLGRSVMAIRTKAAHQRVALLCDSSGPQPTAVAERRPDDRWLEWYGG